ncbi:hypothetical protein Golax_025483, partial [Gossypium laxum]|nr:hypothetical protein [Gossypium laxum]
DLVSIVEEYTTLLRCPRIQVDKAYSRATNVSTFLKKLMSITGMNLILAHLDMKKRVDVFALSIYRDFYLVPLLGVWGASGYALLLALRQYKLRQFIPAMQGLDQCEFANPMTTPEYDWWWGKRVNDNVPVSSQENTQPMEEHLQVIPSELEIIKQDFEKRTSELGKKIEQLEEKKIQLGLDVNI